MKLTRIFAVAFTLMFAAIISINAAPEVKSTDEVAVKIDPTKTEITPSQLPEEVKKAIMDGEYAKWNITKAYKITYAEEGEKEEKVEYEVHFANAQEQKEIEVYDEEGETVED